MWFKSNLASPGAAISEENIIVFACGLDQTKVWSKPHAKTMLFSSHVAAPNEAGLV
jgi:hypothetical protein